MTLENAYLFADEARGIYIPQHFAEAVTREYVTGVTDEDYSILEDGPENEAYWDVWMDVLLKAEITRPDGSKYLLYQDGDLWIVPVEDY